MVSPLLRVHPGSNWRADVEAAWQFLRTHYLVTADENCSTHVHLSLAKGYSPLQLKRFAQAVIHFEPAVEALVPVDRRGNEYARSNWIDNPHFGYRRLSRQQSIMELEACDSIDAVISMMNPHDSKYFGWNFLAIKKYRTVEFRRGAASRSVNDVFMWVEFAMSFLQASLKLRNVDAFSTYPATVGGLSMFIQHAGLQDQPGTTDSRFLDRLFANHGPGETLAPTPVGKLTAEKRKKLEKKIKADSQSNPMLTKIVYAQMSGII